MSCIAMSEKPETMLPLCELATSEPTEMQTDEAMEVEDVEEVMEDVRDDEEVEEVMDEHDYYGMEDEEGMYTDESDTSRSETLGSTSNNDMNCDENELSSVN